MHRDTLQWVRLLESKASGGGDLDDADDERDRDIHNAENSDDDDDDSYNGNDVWTTIKLLQMYV